MLELIDQILTEGYKGCLCVFLLVISAKVYRMKLSTESNCFNGCLKIATSNDGGGKLEIPSVV